MKDKEEIEKREKRGIGAWLVRGEEKKGKNNKARKIKTPEKN